ncbi:GIY-YIG nuclease family protein [Psychroserpens sp.]|jgi:putative endonuclease|uniref:GIY-YIG nuclease family protein n=1 Tax=Psychroserpens sp. TaxID=2020870 RepID=UPI0039E33B3A
MLEKFQFIYLNIQSIWKEGFTYILSNKNRAVLYVGGSTQLKFRVELHMKGKGTKFTKKYSVHELMYFEKYDDSHDAFLRDKQRQNWRSEWKWNLIKSQNPGLKNLYLNL